MYVQFRKILGYLMFEARRLSEISILYTKHLLNYLRNGGVMPFDCDLFNIFIHVSLIETMFNIEISLCIFL